MMNNEFNWVVKLLAGAAGLYLLVVEGRQRGWI
jgi:hypothetical protein